MGESRLYCLGCYYDLRGLPEPRCPECGRGFDPDDPKTYSDTPRPERLKKLMHHAALALSDAMDAMRPPEPPAREIARLKHRTTDLELENQLLRCRFEAVLTLLEKKGLIDADELRAEIEERIRIGRTIQVVDDMPEPEEDQEDEPTAELLELKEAVEKRSEGEK